MALLWERFTEASSDHPPRSAGRPLFAGTNERVQIGHAIHLEWRNLWRLSSLNFHCYILRSVCLQKGDKLATGYLYSYINCTLRFLERLKLNVKYHLQTKTLGPGQRSSSLS